MEEKIFIIFSNLMELPLKDVSITMTPDDIETWDSLHHIELIVSLEEEFDILFSDDQIDELKSLEQIINTVKYLLNKK